MSQTSSWTLESFPPELTNQHLHVPVPLTHTPHINPSLSCSSHFPKPDPETANPSIQLSPRIWLSVTRRSRLTPSLAVNSSDLRLPSQPVTVRGFLGHWLSGTRPDYLAHESLISCKIQHPLKSIHRPSPICLLDVLCLAARPRPPSCFGHSHHRLFFESHHDLPALVT